MTQRKCPPAKYRSFLVALTALFSAVASLSGQNASLNTNTSKTEKYRLVWFEDPTTTATFVWNQLEGDPATLYYGLKNEGRNKSKYAERKEVDRVVEYDGMRNCMVTLAPDHDVLDRTRGTDEIVSVVGNLIDPAGPGPPASKHVSLLRRLYTKHAIISY